jgi:hypothetical protein
MKMYSLVVGLVTASWLIGGCAAKATLHTEVESAAIRSAEQSGAEEVPRAALHLQLAKEELEAATALHKSGDKEEAESMLLRAEADAELAIVLSLQDAEKTEAEAAIARVLALRAENN